MVQTKVKQTSKNRIQSILGSFGGRAISLLSPELILSASASSASPWYATRCAQIRCTHRPRESVDGLDEVSSPVWSLGREGPWALGDRDLPGWQKVNADLMS